jgi:hypothetical protein
LHCSEKELSLFDGTVFSDLSNRWKSVFIQGGVTKVSQNMFLFVFGVNDAQSILQRKKWIHFLKVFVKKHDKEVEQHGGGKQNSDLQHVQH